MTKILLNKKNIDDFFLPKLNNAINNLSYAINWVSDLEIPSDFYYCDYLINIGTKNQETLDKLTLKKSNLNSIISRLSTKETTNEEMFEDMKIPKINNIKKY